MLSLLGLAGAGVFGALAAEAGPRMGADSCL